MNRPVKTLNMFATCVLVNVALFCLCFAFIMAVPISLVAQVNSSALLSPFSSWLAHARKSSFILTDSGVRCWGEETLLPASLNKPWALASDGESYCALDGNEVKCWG